MKNLNIKPEEIAFVVTVGLSIAVSILDFLGILGGIPWLSERIPTLTLLLLSITSGYLVVEKRTRLANLESLNRSGTENILKEIENSTRYITKMIESGSVQVFENPESMYEELISMTRAAKSSIDISSFGETNPTQVTTNDMTSSLRRNYYETLS